jgi:hypothetical protein
MKAPKTTITREDQRRMRKRADRERDIERGFVETVTKVHRSEKDYTRKKKYRETLDSY